MNIHHLPKRLHVEHLEPGEEIKLFLRRHVIVFWQKATLFVVLAFVPPIIWILLYSQTALMDDPQNAVRIIIILITSLFYLYWLRHLFTMWIDYYLDVWIVTTHRIMNIEHKGLFHRKVSEQRLERVQDITTESSGVLQTTLHFGDIHVQTAAETEHFIFRDIEDPEEVSREIMELQSAAMQRAAGSNEAELQEPSLPTQQLS